MHRLAALVLTLAVLSAAAPNAFAAQAAATPSGRPANAKDPTPEEVRQIEAAAAQIQPAARPERTRRVLIFSVSFGYWHDAIPYGQAAFKALGEKTGAYQAVVSDDPANFEPGKLDAFDAVVFNNTNNELFLPGNFDTLPAAEKAAAEARDAALKRSFAEYLAFGKGLVVVHAGVASFRKWPEFGEIIGARFTSHPWQKASVRIDEPDHPVAAAFGGKPFDLVDEIYQVENPYSRSNVRVLLSLDPARTDLKAKGVARTDADFAMTWVKLYGRGRVYYNAFGHRHEIYWNPAILKHWLDGVQFATGDLKADAAPRP